MKNLLYRYAAWNVVSLGEGRPIFCAALALSLLFSTSVQAAQPSDQIEAGIAVRDVTPEGPIWLAGYAARRRPSDRVDQPLLAQALALRSDPTHRMVLVALDNCEVSRAFMAPVLEAAKRDHGLQPGEVMVVSSHTHSGPVLESNLLGMYQFPEVDHERVRRYSERLQVILGEVIGSALTNLQPAVLEHGIGRARFACNRRVFREERVEFGENREGPVDWEVPVLKIRGTNDSVRAIVFGYACHGTSIQADDFYTVSPDYMGYARAHLESVYPGATAVYLTGMGADSNPSPRGQLLNSKRHGLELAGAVVSVLERPMRRLRGPVRLAFADLDLPLEPAPTREQLDKDVLSPDVYIRKRAELHLKLLDAQAPLPATVRLPMSILRIGRDLTFFAMGGEVVVDYSLRMKRLFADEHPWTLGYAYDVPCYIPSVRILKEGGYEPNSSLIYYGIYGPFKGRIEDMIVDRMTGLLSGLRANDP